jgi:hypothetical protein
MEKHSMHDEVRAIRNLIEWQEEAMACGYIVTRATIDRQRLAWKTYCRENRLPEIVVRVLENGSVDIFVSVRGTDIEALVIWQIIDFYKHCSFPDDAIHVSQLSLSHALMFAEKIAKEFFRGRQSRESA